MSAASKKARHWLRDLFVKEISVVDKPANSGAVVTLAKRGDTDPDPDHMRALLASIASIFEADVTKQEKNAAIAETLKQYAEVTSRDGIADIAEMTKRSRHKDPLENEPPGVRGVTPPHDARNFGAGGAGPTHDKLYTIYDNYRREMGPLASSAAFEAAWADLTDEEKDEIRNEEAATQRVRDAEESKRRAAAAKEGSMMKSQLIEVAKRVVAGSEKTISRSDLVDAAHKIALAERQPGETIEAARARFWESPAGTGVYRAMKVAKVEDAVATPKLEFGPAVKALHKRADEIRAGKSMTREQAVAKIASDPGEARIWNAARAEERERDQFLA
jgi:hypothetical protein